MACLVAAGVVPVLLFRRGAQLILIALFAVTALTLGVVRLRSDHSTGRSILLQVVLSFVVTVLFGVGLRTSGSLSPQTHELSSSETSPTQSPEQTCAQAADIIEKTQPRGTVDAPMETVADLSVPGFTKDGGQQLDLEMAVSTRSRNQSVWRQKLVQADFVKGFRASFYNGLTNAWVDAWEFGSADGADLIHRFANDQTCPYANDVFRIDGIPDTLGFQIRWREGNVTEQVSFVRGNRRYLVGAANDNGGAPSRLVVEAFARAVSGS